MAIEGEVYLLKDFPIKFDLPAPNAQKVKTVWFQHFADCKFSPVDAKSESDTTLTQKLNAGVYSHLYPGSSIQMSFRNRSEKHENTGTYQPKVDLIEISVWSPSLFNGMLKDLGQDTKVRIEIKNVQVDVVAANPWPESCSAVMTRNQQDQRFYAACKFPQRWALYWNTATKTKYSALVSIIAVCGQVDSSKRIKLDDGPIQASLHSDNIKQSIKTLLDKGLGTDTTIITGEGTRVQCHKCFLMVLSPVFASMLKGNFVEGQTHEIKLDDMSDKGVKAFIAFLYCREIKAPFDDPKIAVELLLAAHKYAIPILENAMKALLLVKPLEWFDIPSALDLFFFAKNVDTLSELKEKSLVVLKMNKTEFLSSEEFKELFDDGDKGEAVKELFANLLNV